jgi:metal-responsive CopG/Arc/MetJ family transcriptional regulator
MNSEQRMVTMGVSLYERQLPALEELEQQRGSPGRSAVLRQIIDEYLAQQPVLRLVEARRRGLVTHQEAVAKFATLIERNGDGDGVQDLVG